MLGEMMRSKTQKQRLAKNGVEGMPKILVTGGAGFIGSNMVAALLAGGGYQVVVCDQFGSDDKWRNLAKHTVTEFVAPRDMFIWLEMFGDEVEAVIHMGAISSTTEKDVDLILETNHTLSLALMRWCTQNQVRFIYASSAATYGDGSAGFDDSYDPRYLARLKPLNPYAWSKHSVDLHLVARVMANDPMPPQWVGLKFFNVYGPNEYHKGNQRSVACTIFPDAKAGKPVKLFKSHRPDYQDGGQLRDFIHVKDCVQVILWMLANPQVSGLFNVGTGQARSFADLAHAVFAALGKPPSIEYIDMPEAIRDRYQYFTQAEMGRLYAAGYRQPFTSLEEGVRDYVQNYLMQDDPYL
jgi:ADP-L-glycero-D-manno-heptose 6-epimerase